MLRLTVLVSLEALGGALCLIFHIVTVGIIRGATPDSSSVTGGIMWGPMSDSFSCILPSVRVFLSVI